MINMFISSNLLSIHVPFCYVPNAPEHTLHALLAVPANNLHAIHKYYPAEPILRLPKHGLVKVQRAV